MVQNLDLVRVTDITKGKQKKDEKHKHIYINGECHCGELEAF